MANTEGTTGLSKSESVLRAQTVSSKKHDVKKYLTQLTVSLTMQDLEATLSTLKRIFDNVIQHPNDDKYRQIKLTGKTFSNKVWQYPAGQELMKMSGWVVEGDHVRLRDDSHVQTVSKLVDQHIKELREATSSPYATNVSSIRASREHGDRGVSAGSIVLSKCCTLSEDAALGIASAIYDGHGGCLKRVLKPYHVSCVKNMQLGDFPIIGLTFLYQQIGIARILIKEYGLDVNALNEEGMPYFLKLFDGCNSTESCQSLIIQFIKEFSIDVNKHNHDYTALHMTILHKQFSITRFLVEECKVDVNCKGNAINGGTPLHAAYGIGDTKTAQYLIEHGADQETIDIDGRKPKDCEFYAGSSNYYIRFSNYIIKRRVIHANTAGPEYNHFQRLCKQGIPQNEAVDATYKEFPSLQKEIDDGDLVNQETLKATPTPKKLNRYVTDMAPSYYDIGLQLDIADIEMKLIRDDPSLPGLKEKCRKMLEMWLENDTSATWKKLCNALEVVKLSVLAEQIKLA